MTLHPRRISVNDVDSTFLQRRVLIEIAMKNYMTISMAYSVVISQPTRDVDPMLAQH